MRARVFCLVPLLLLGACAGHLPAPGQMQDHAQRTQSSLDTAALRQFLRDHGRAPKHWPKQRWTFEDLALTVLYQQARPGGAETAAKDPWILRQQLRHAFVDYYAATRDFDPSRQQRSLARLAHLLSVPLPVLAAKELDGEDLRDLPSLRSLPASALEEMALRKRQDLHSALTDFAAADGLLRTAIGKTASPSRDSAQDSYAWNPNRKRWEIMDPDSTMMLRPQGPPEIVAALVRRQQAAAAVLALQRRIIGDVDLAQMAYVDALRDWNRVPQRLSVRQASRPEAEAARASFVHVQNALGRLESCLQHPLREEDVAAWRLFSATSPGRSEAVPKPRIRHGKHGIFDGKRVVRRLSAPKTVKIYRFKIAPSFTASMGGQWD